MLVFESKLMTDTHEKSLMRQAADYLQKKDYLTKENFLNIEFWFERDPNVNIKSGIYFIINRIIILKHIDF